VRRLKPSSASPSASSTLGTQVVSAAPVPESDRFDPAYTITIVGSGCANLWLGYAYCVKGTQSTATATGPGGPVQNGIASNCNAYYTVASGDSCAAIESRYDLTFAQLYQWNPAIGSNCENLWVGYAVCVGVSP